MHKSEKLTVKDIITCGIFSTISLIALFIAIIANLTPYTMIFFAALAAFLGGIPFVLMNVRVPKRGAVIIYSIVPLLYYAVTGIEGLIVAAALLVFSLLAELVLGRDRNQFRRIMFSYVIYTAYLSVGGSFRIFTNTTAYLTAAAQSGLDGAYIDTLRGLISYPVWGISIAVTALLAAAGSALGYKLLKKHFMKAGVA